MPYHPQTQADIEQLTGLLKTIASDLINGKGLAVGLGDVGKAVLAGKRLAGKEGAGREVFTSFLGQITTEHPEVIDIAFAGLSEIAKARIRKACGGPGEIKDAERA